MFAIFYGLLIGVIIPLAYTALYDKGVMSGIVRYLEGRISLDNGEIDQSKYWVIKVIGGCPTCSAGQFAFWTIPIVCSTFEVYGVILAAILLVHIILTLLFANKLLLLIMSFIYIGLGVYFVGVCDEFIFLFGVLCSVAISYQVERRFL